MKVAVAGVCASGKSTLARGLRAAGYDAVDIAQEHSDVPYMWQAITQPDALIFLDAGDDTVRARSPHIGTDRFLGAQRGRLAHARAHADLIVNVDQLSAPQVLARVLAKLERLHDTGRRLTND